MARLTAWFQALILCASKTPPLLDGSPADVVGQEMVALITLVSEPAAVNAI